MVHAVDVMSVAETSALACSNIMQVVPQSDNSAVDGATQSRPRLRKVCQTRQGLRRHPGDTDGGTGRHGRLGVTLRIIPLLISSSSMTRPTHCASRRRRRQQQRRQRKTRQRIRRSGGGNFLRFLLKKMSQQAEFPRNAVIARPITPAKQLSMIFVLN